MRRTKWCKCSECRRWILIERSPKYTVADDEDSCHLLVRLCDPCIRDMTTHGCKYRVNAFDGKCIDWNTVFCTLKDVIKCKGDEI